MQLKKCEDNLKHYYLKRLNQKLSTRWPKLGDPTLYLDVTIVRAQCLPKRKQKDVSQVLESFCEEYAMGLLDKKAEISNVPIDNLLLDGKGEVTLIEGDPGSGKTTLTLQICKKWAMGELLKEELLIWVPLRYYKSVTNIDELFDKFDCPMPGMKEYAQMSNGEGLVLLLDGWDELPNQLRTSSLFHDIVFSKSKSFFHSTILVTSRPTCSDDIAEVVEERKGYYQILGFSPQNAVTYIEKYFDNDFQSAKLLFSFLKDHQTLRRHFYIPITVAIMCFVYSHSENGQIPETLSKLYERFVVLYIRSNVPDICCQDMKGFSSLSSVPEKLKLIFSELCKTAYNTLKDKKLVFDEMELEVTKESIENLHLEHFDGFGLLCIGHYTSELATREKSYSFIHRAVQELLAAIFILDIGTINSTLEEYFYEDSYLINMFPFLFGLVSKELLRPLGEKLGQIFVKSNRSEVLLSSIMYCFFEACDVTLCREFGQVFNEKRDINLRLYSLLECHYAYYFISVCGCNQLTLSIFHELFGLSADLCFEIMAKYFGSTSTDITSFQCVIGSVSCKGIEHFTKVLSTQNNLVSVKLFSFSLSDPDCITILCDSICKHNAQIVHLSLPYAKLNKSYLESIGCLLTACLSLESLNTNCLPSENEEACLDLSVNFCKALCETKSLQTLILYGWSLSQADSEIFSNIISQNCSLKELRVHVATADHLLPILNGLSSNTSIMMFRVCCSKKGVSYAKKLGQCVEKCLTLNHSLRCIDFVWFKRKYMSWSSTQVISICAGLCANTTVVTLDISGCEIDAEACHAVCEMLSQNTTLRHLFVNPIHLEKQEAVAMIDSCKANATLELFSLVQWPPNSRLTQGKNVFQFSSDQEIMCVLQQTQKFRQDQNRTSLTMCWLVVFFV